MLRFAHLIPLINLIAVPCGIFDDPAIVAEIEQAAATIRKAMVQSTELHAASSSAQNINQIVRWVNTKEEHASKIIKLVSEYCLCQVGVLAYVFAFELR